MRLAAVGLATALVYGVWVAWVPLLPRNLYVPLLDLGKMTGYTWPSTVIFIGLIASLFALYAIGYHLARTAKPALVLGFGALFCALLLFAYPATAVDVFGYVAHGRLLGLHAANPFVVAPNAFPNDPILPFLAFPGEPSQYGPAWVLLGAAISLLARLTADALLAEVVLYKLAGAAAHLASAALVLSVATRLGAPRARAIQCAYLFVWNPTLLWEMVGNAHNDGVMMLAGLLSAWLLLTRAWVLVLPALALGALVKIPVAVLGPLFFVAVWRHRKLAALEGAALASVLLVLVYRPFWDGPATLTVLQRSDLFTASLGALLRLGLEARLGPEQASAIAGWTSHGLFGLIVGACVVLAFRTRDSAGALRLGYVTLLAAALLATTWFQAWYVVWPFALGAALPAARRHLEVALLSLGGLLQYVVFIYLWVMAVLPPDQLFVIQSAAVLGLLGPLVLGASLAFARRARYAH